MELIGERKYTITEKYVSSTALHIWEEWSKYIIEILGQKRKDMPMVLFTLGPDEKKSIGYDIGTILTHGKFNSVCYLITDISNVSNEDFKDLVNSDEFYLGFTFIVIGFPSDEEIRTIILCSDNDYVFSGQEIIKMGNDGCSLFLYNI
jgi:hypothetical protein